TGAEIAWEIGLVIGSCWKLKRKDSEAEVGMEGDVTIEGMLRKLLSICCLGYI
ncbi:1256_t:CDS:1, partial [Scutellospora calospora]